MSAISFKKKEIEKKDGGSFRELVSGVQVSWGGSRLVSRSVEILS